MFIFLWLNRSQHRAADEFLAGIAASAAGGAFGGLNFFTRPLAAAQLQKDQKRVVLFNMHGGLSQLESWDPKPGTETGGPFRSISTSVPGIQISELLPNVARTDAPSLPVARRQHQRRRPRQRCLLDDHGPQANPGRRIPGLRRRLRQGHGLRRRSPSLATS